MIELLFDSPASVAGWVPIDGRLVPAAPALAPARVVQVGLMVGDGQAGPFRLALRHIQCLSQPDPAG
jgi:hypothetical protein